MLPPSALDELITGVYGVAQGDVTWQHWLSLLGTHSTLEHATLELWGGATAPQRVAELGLGDGAELLGTSSVDGLRLRYTPHDGPLEATWDLLRPHLQRALGLPQLVADQLATVAVPMRALTEVMGVGLLLLRGTDLRVDYANVAARALLERIQTLGLSQGRLTTRDASLRSSLVAALREVLGDVARNGRQLWFEEDGGRFGLLVHCMNAWRLAARSGEAQDQTLVIMSAAEQLPGLREDYLAARYGLSPKESRLVIGLMQGRALDVQALSYEVSVHTLRTQLKSVLRKTAASSQVALLNLLSADPCLLFDPPEVSQ